MTYSDLRRFTSTNAASVVDGNLWLVLKPWSGTAHNKREWLERHHVLQARMTSNPVLQAIKQKYALHRNMKYSIREICLFLKALKQNSQFQGRMTWFILRSSSHLDKTALNAETLDAAYVKYASFLKPWSKTTHFKGGSRETYRVLRPLRWNCVLHWQVQYAWYMPFSPGHETRLLDPEFGESKICFIISFWRWKKLVNRNMILHNVSNKRSLSQRMSAVSCIPSIFMTINMSSSSRIEKLSSSYFSESAGWKVLHEKKKKKNYKRLFSSCGQFQRILCIIHTPLVYFKWGNLSKSYCRYRSF